MDQTKLGSLYEAAINTFIGFWINFLANWMILPLVGFTTLTLETNLLIGALFTIISVARGYLIRRFFNARLRALAARLARASESLGESRT